MHGNPLVVSLWNHEPTARPSTGSGRARVINRPTDDPTWCSGHGEPSSERVDRIVEAGVVGERPQLSRHRLTPARHRHADAEPPDRALRPPPPVPRAST